MKPPVTSYCDTTFFFVTVMQWKSFYKINKIRILPLFLVCRTENALDIKFNT